MAYEVSFVIPARNEEWLGITIQDILKSIGGNSEVIAVLDGYTTPVPEIPQDPRVRIIKFDQSVGQRAATNAAVKLSEARYIVKCDAHCAFDEGWDVKMMEAIKGHADWTMVSTMRNLHVFNWKCPDGHTRYQSPSGPCKEIVNGKECGKPTVKDVVWIPKTNPQSNSYCFDTEPHFQYFRDYNNRPEGKGDLTETLSLQGSCFMVTRDKYWELNLGDESFGSWGSQGIQVACSTWLSGGKVMVNHKTWYGHCFRTQGGDFGFPYPISGSQVSRAKKHAKELFFENKFHKQIHPLSWLIEKFWPVPHWTDADLTKLKEEESKLFETRKKELGIVDVIPSVPVSIPTPVESAEVSEKKPTVGVIYYTDNLLNPVIMKACQEQLRKAFKGEIISASLKKIDFGDKNIHFPNLNRAPLTMFKQILSALEHSTAKVIFFCEHDILYAPEHFDFVPPDKETFYYNMNSWIVRCGDGHAVYYDHRSLNGLCVYRETAIKHYRERVALVEKGGYNMTIGYEPFTHNRIQWVNQFKADSWRSERPNIDLKHGTNLTPTRWKQDQFKSQKNCQNWRESDITSIPGWDFAELEWICQF